MKVSRFAVNHPAIIGMLVIVLVAFGFYSLSGLNLAFMADMSLPQVLVLTLYPGASAEVVEEDVSTVIEDNMVTLPNFKAIDSQSGNSYSLVTITFQDGIDPQDMLPEVRQRLTEIEDSLPDNLQGEPTALIGGAEMLPIFTFSVSNADEEKLHEYLQETIIPRITRIDGVSTVDVSGERERQLTVRLRADDLKSRGVPVLNVYQVLAASDTEFPLGNAEYRSDSVSLRYEGGIDSIEDIENLAVGAGDDGTIIRLRDVADVYIEAADPEIFVDSEGKAISVVQVSKRKDGNTVNIVNEIKRAFEEIEADTGGTIEIEILSDDSRMVDASLGTVINSGVMGVIMAVLVIFLFLGDPKATLIIGLSIPFCILFTFIGLRIAGISLNLMSLSGIVTALGMVVDGSIVMLEQVYRYLKTGRYTVKQAIFRGSDEVGTSILASTLTTVAVFIPLAMLSGILGMILRDVALTLIMCLSASLVVAIVVVPFLLRVLKKDGEKFREFKAVNRGVAAVERVYRRGISWSLKNKWFIIFLAVLIFGLSIYLAMGLGLSFIPSTDSGDFYVDMEFPAGYTTEKTRAKAYQAEMIIRRELGPMVDTVATYIGQSGTWFGLGNSTNLAYCKVLLVPSGERDVKIREILPTLQSTLASEVPDCTFTLTNGGFDKLLGYVTEGGGYGVTLVGDNMSELYAEAEKIRDVLREDPDVMAVAIDTSYDNSAVVFDMSQEYMASLGITSYEAGMITGVLFRGQDVGAFRDPDSGNTYGIRLESDLTEKPLTYDVLSSIQVRSAAGTFVDFASIGDFATETAISTINRADRARTVKVTANLVSEDTSKVLQRMNAYFEENPLPQGIERQSGGVMALISDSIPPLMTAVVIAFFLVYTVMVIQFERFEQPFIIMICIPLCFIGVVLGLLFFNSTVSIMAILAIVSLGGVVVNNGIILVDYINTLRDQRREVKMRGLDEKILDEPDNDISGFDAREVRLDPDFEDDLLFRSICDGASSRIRPIAMTVLTTMLGVVPMAFANGEGAEIYAPLGQAIAGGLLTSTVLTLFVIPVLYYLTERRALRKKAKKAKIAREAVK